ncbi:DUF551 domain-containing protein [Salmonella enterica]|nr:DUF551 domain-containing protein [Salmonella enterica]ECV0359206.1 DUF551 domain-containing protein [Salmonella enterica subsp. enterica serovar Bareilly]EJG2873083.1 DUF551 domain-containing protein [Salmonella enterica subsp. enterica serovar Norwich]EBC5384086.1 DUF551 domain-containing protein [Salmonella enterica]EBI1058457.1 DUF551 domain-containing protein [Salmonella enterica]
MTITKERLLKIQHWRETYGADSNVMLPAEEAEELARIALAALEVAPVGEVSEKRHGLVMDGTVDLGGKSTYRIIKGEKAMKRLPLGTKFYIVPPVPVDNEFIPKNLDRALGVVGVALPESKEEFNFQTERWIQRLIDRVIRYADEFKEQPVPVVPEEKPMPNSLSMYAVDAVAAIAEVRGWNACRSAMLQGVEPVSQTYKLNELSGNSPVTPDGWISCSERMPEDEQEVIVHNKLGYRYVSYFDEHSGLFFDMRGGNQMNCIEHILVTHWMPLPAPPQQ